MQQLKDCKFQKLQYTRSISQCDDMSCAQTALPRLVVAANLSSEGTVGRLGYKAYDFVTAPGVDNWSLSSLPPCLPGKQSSSQFSGRPAQNGCYKSSAGQPAQNGCCNTNGLVYSDGTPVPASEKLAQYVAENKDSLEKVDVKGSLKRHSDYWKTDLLEKKLDWAPNLMSLWHAQSAYVPLHT